MQVQVGTVTLEVANESVTLHAGDAVTFPGDVTHPYANPGSQHARFSLAVFEPGVGLAASIGDQQWLTSALPRPHGSG